MEDRKAIHPIHGELQGSLGRRWIPGCKFTVALFGGEVKININQQLVYYPVCGLDNCHHTFLPPTLNFPTELRSSTHFVPLKPS